MAAVASIVVTETQVRQFLNSLLGRPGTPAAAAVHDKALAAPPAVAELAEVESTTASLSASAANPWLLSPAAAAPAGTGSFTTDVPLRLHPRVDAVHPLGEAHSSEELECALQLYRQLVKDSRFAVNEIMVGPDKAVVTGHQIVTSHLKSMTDKLSLHSLPHQVQHFGAEFLPSLTEARVPTTIQLKFGKSDAGYPVVTQMAVNFSLPAVLVPHLSLQPWQQSALQQAKQPLVHMLVTAGSLAATLEDVGTSLSATWRATAAVLQATVGTLVSEIRERMQSAAAAGAERAGSGGLNGAHG